MLFHTLQQELAEADAAYPALAQLLPIPCCWIWMGRWLRHLLHNLMLLLHKFQRNYCINVLQELDEALAEAGDSKVVVLFSALTWCRPCKGMQRPAHKLAERCVHLLPHAQRMVCVGVGVGVGGLQASSQQEIQHMTGPNASQLAMHSVLTTWKLGSHVDQGRIEIFN
eukprot:174082-Pelagomonas_calceolata.AAC.4